MEIIYSFTTKLYVYENEHKRKIVNFRLFEAVMQTAKPVFCFRTFGGLTKHYLHLLPAWMLRKACTP